MMDRRRLLFVLSSLLAATALLWTSFGSLDAAAAQKAVEIHRAHDGDHAPSFKEPIFILVLGGDARSGNPARVRMDAIQIVGINFAQGVATTLGIPRDSYVNIPGRGRGKINGAGPAGGPELMVRTVRELSGCDFDYYMLTSFGGFKKLVDDFGGLEFDAPYRLNDPIANRDSGPIPEGKQTLTGSKALAWARSRYARPRGDFDRSLAQAQLMLAALNTARARASRDAATSLRALAVLRRNVRASIPLDEALRLGIATMRIDPAKVVNEVVDGDTGNVGGSSVVQISARGRRQLADICDDAILGNS